MRILKLAHGLKLTLSLLVACTSLAGPAAATLSADLAAGLDGLADSADNFSDPALASVYGHARRGGSAFVNNEELWPAADPCPSCDATTPDYAVSNGEIVADQARFRSNARVQTAGTETFGAARVDLFLEDTLHFAQAGTAIFDAHIGLDLDAFDFGFDGAGHSHFTFEILLAPLLCPSGECTSSVFFFEAQDYSNGSDLDGWTVDGQHDGAKDDLALDFRRIVDVPAGDFVLGVRAHALAECDPGSSTCSAAVDFSSTGYLGITGDFTSASGYRYPGYAAVVPEPSAALLLGSGLALLGQRRRVGSD